MQKKIIKLYLYINLLNIYKINLLKLIYLINNKKPVFIIFY